MAAKRSPSHSRRKSVPVVHEDKCCRDTLLKLARPRREACGIRLLLLDVDGVLTNGSIALLPDGREIKFFSIYDGMGIRQAQEAGIEVGLISGRKSPAVRCRARELGINLVVEGSTSKLDDFQKIISERHLKPGQVAFMGDDLPDLPLLCTVGISAAPANSVDAVKRVVRFVSRAKGGEGAVREFVEQLLSGAFQGKTSDQAS
ncbi:MAG: HAD hydrolase family protein [Acidobacteria bacterium]|nr:HAD hydrolase family protein [Acidobacteriota bacterium]